MLYHIYFFSQIILVATPSPRSFLYPFGHRFLPNGNVTLKGKEVGDFFVLFAVFGFFATLRVALAFLQPS